MTCTWREHAVAAGALSLVLVIGLAGIHKTTDIVLEAQAYPTLAVGELTSSVVVGQTFVASYDGLSAIQVILGSYDRQNSGEIVFRLRTSLDATEDLVVIRFDAGEIEGNIRRDFEFEAIRDSAGRSFHFFLEAPEAEPGNAIAVLGCREDVFAHGEAVVHGLADEQVSDLTFQLLYDPPLLGEVDACLDHLTANKPSVFGDRWLYVGLAGSYLVLLYVFVLRLAGLATPEDEVD